MVSFSGGILTDKYLNKFPKEPGWVLSLEWLKEKNLTEDKLAKISLLNELSNDLGMILPVMSIGWCLKNENVSTVILGASNVSAKREHGVN